MNSDDGTTENTWLETLDAMERSLDHYQATVDGLTSEPDPYWPAVVPPQTPLPVELTARAAAIMSRSNQLTADIEEKLQSLPPRPPARVHRRPVRTVSVFDVTA